MSWLFEIAVFSNGVALKFTEKNFVILNQQLIIRDFILREYQNKE